MHSSAEFICWLAAFCGPLFALLRRPTRSCRLRASQTDEYHYSRNRGCVNGTLAHFGEQLNASDSAHIRFWFVESRRVERMFILCSKFIDGKIGKVKYSLKLIACFDVQSNAIYLRVSIRLEPTNPPHIIHTDILSPSFFSIFFELISLILSRWASPERRQLTRETHRLLILSAVRSFARFIRRSEAHKLRNDKSANAYPLSRRGRTIFTLEAERRIRIIIAFTPFEAHTKSDDSSRQL